MIEVKLTFANEQELLAFFTRTEIPVSVDTAAAAKPAVQEAPKAAPPAPEEPASVPPTSSGPEATSAPAAPIEPAPAPAPQAAAPAPAAPVKYEDSGIPSMVPAYLGKPGSEGYDARRAALVALLAKYGVSSAKALQPEQFAPFKAELEAL
jgi:hypothetical protein